MKLGNIVKKLRLDNNCLVILKTGSALATYEALQGLNEVLSHTSLQNVILVVADNLDDAFVTHEKELNKLGWYHISALNKMIRNQVVREIKSQGESHD